MSSIKRFCVDSVSFLASIIIFYLGLDYFSTKALILFNNFFGIIVSILIILISFGFVLLCVCFVFKDGLKLLKANKENLINRVLVLFIFFTVTVGLLGTLFSSVNEVRVNYINYFGRFQPIPDTLKEPCKIPEIPKNMTYKDSIILNFKLLSSLEECNIQLKTIRELDKISNKENSK